MSENSVRTLGGGSNWLLGFVSTAIGLWSGLNWDKTFEVAHSLGADLPRGLVELIAWAVVIYGTITWAALIFLAFALVFVAAYSIISLYG